MYRHLDDRDLLLYVGVTANLKQRWQNHSSWWEPFVVRTEVEWFPSRQTALAAEAALIRTAVPLFNGEHNKNPHPPLAALYQSLRSALPGRPAIEELRKLYPSPVGPLMRWPNRSDRSPDGQDVVRLDRQSGTASVGPMASGMRFGLFVPQGWRHDLVGIAPAQQWQTMRDLARWVDRDRVGFSSIWV